MTYNYDSIVSTEEAAALKEMIFKRVRERAASLNEETQNTYTSSVKSDIMDLARESFVASKNPFSINESENKVKKEDNVIKEPPEVIEARKRAEEIREQINYRNKIASENIANENTLAAMNDARESLAKKTSFMGALEFLNSQATIGLVSKSGSKFSAMA